MFFVNGLSFVYKDGFEALMIVLMLLITPFISLLNLKSVSFNYYKVLKKDLLGANLISFVIGFIMSILLLVINHY